MYMATKRRRGTRSLTTDNFCSRLGSSCREFGTSRQSRTRHSVPVACGAITVKPQAQRRLLKRTDLAGLRPEPALRHHAGQGM